MRHSAAAGLTTAGCLVPSGHPTNCVCPRSFHSPRERGRTHAGSSRKPCKAAHLTFLLPVPAGAPKRPVHQGPVERPSLIPAGAAAARLQSGRHVRGSPRPKDPPDRGAHSPRPVILPRPTGRPPPVSSAREAGGSRRLISRRVTSHPCDPKAPADTPESLYSSAAPRPNTQSADARGHSRATPSANPTASGRSLHAPRPPGAAAHANKSDDSTAPLCIRTIHATGP